MPTLLGTINGLHTSCSMTPVKVSLRHFNPSFTAKMSHSTQHAIIKSLNRQSRLTRNPHRHGMALVPIFGGQYAHPPFTTKSSSRRSSRCVYFHLIFHRIIRVKFKNLGMSGTYAPRRCFTTPQFWHGGANKVVIELLIIRYKMNLSI